MIGKYLVGGIAGMVSGLGPVIQGWFGEPAAPAAPAPVVAPAAAETPRPLLPTAQVHMPRVMAAPASVSAPPMPRYSRMVVRGVHRGTDQALYVYRVAQEVHSCDEQDAARPAPIAPVRGG